MTMSPLQVSANQSLAKIIRIFDVTVENVFFLLGIVILSQLFLLYQGSMELD